MTSPPLTTARRRELATRLDSARHALGSARLTGDPAAEAMAHAELHSIRLALGESSESWWEDAA